MNTYVIKLGGSMVSESDEVVFNFDFLKEFSNVIREFVDEGNRAVIVLGGGFMARKLRDMAREAGISEDLQLHWIGTTYNNVNAEIVRAFMNDIANERIFVYEDYYDDKEIKFEKPVIVGGGGRAGHSGDVDALVLAKRIDVDKVISLKNIDGVYSADPKKDPSAVRKDNLTWDEYLDIVGNKDKHEPGGNYPIDVIASRDAKENGKTFVIIAGKDIENFRKVLKGEDFIGTTVS